MLVADDEDDFALAVNLYTRNIKTRFRCRQKRRLNITLSESLFAPAVWRLRLGLIRNYDLNSFDRFKAARPLQRRAAFSLSPWRPLLICFALSRTRSSVSRSRKIGVSR
jgi:hypothetical protein